MSAQTNDRCMDGHDVTRARETEVQREGHGREYGSIRQCTGRQRNGMTGTGRMGHRVVRDQGVSD
jgi:hypothetical protein